MPVSRRVVAVVLAGLALVAASLGANAQTARTTVTFILVNDIYQMSAQAMADGRSRGGFARLAAVVKAERAKGGHVVFAHAGDTLSPSLMSGFDRGARGSASRIQGPRDRELRRRADRAHRRDL